jgi:hypothetical protein
MPTASPEVRKPWHDKRRLVHIAKEARDGIPNFFGWALVPNGDGAAMDYLLKRGYIDHRYTWYRPKASLLIAEPEKWTPTEKETSALRYLSEEWDQSYDLRGHRAILAEERKRVIDAMPMSQREVDSWLVRYTTMVRVFLQ